MKLPYYPTRLRSTQSTTLLTPARFRLHGILIDNVKMSSAVDWVSQDRPNNTTRIGFFANAHTVTSSWDDNQLLQDLNFADRVYADGIGVKIAAQNCGIDLVDNVNGTDLLPHLAHRLAQQGKSLALLGSRPGVAQVAAQKLVAQYPGLRVVYAHHGYFESEQSDKIIEDINNSGANVLLVAQGSPLQERWLIANRNALQVDCALAVGGLLDFLSGRIPRAPRWVRSLHCEWIFRLI